MTRRVIAVVAVCLTLLLLPGVAAAEPPEQAAELCSRTSDCRIITPATWLRDGTTVAITVRGAPNVRFELVAHQVVVDADNNVQGFEPIGTTGDLFTRTDGVVHAELELPARRVGEHGGLVVLSTAGLTELDVDLFGLVLPYGTSTPIVLGDGFAGAKPVGAALELRLTATVQGSQFRVEYEPHSGHWENVTASGGDSPEPSGGPGAISTVTYFVPQGLEPRPYRFRLVNASTGAVVEEWDATPDAEGIPQCYREPLTADSLGVELGVRTDDHPLQAVRVVSAVLGTAALGVVCIGTPLANRRARAGSPHA